jgi:hypothetical protein
VNEPRGRSASLLLILALVAYVLLAYGDALFLPFLQDDWTILEKVKRVAPSALLAPRELLYGWYRPWSRELHFAVLDRVFGMAPFGWHIVSFVLWTSVLTLYAAYARRVAGTRAAVIATLGLAAVGAWSGTLLWVSGAQELWMFLFVLAGLLAFANGRVVLTTLATIGALASKETAAALPLLAFLHAWRVDRNAVPAALRRTAPMLLVTIAWLGLHPGLRAKIGGGGERVELHPLSSLARSVLASINLERVPNPEGGWIAALLGGLPAVLVLLLAAWWLLREPKEDSPATTHSARNMGLAWFAIGLVPATLAVTWSPYYALLAACGLWLVLGDALSKRPALVLPVLAVVALLQPVQARTPAWEWAGPAFQRRAARYVEPLRLALRRDHPTVPAGTRFFVADVPQGTGVGHDWFTPAFRVWYRDTTLHANFLSHYTPRTSGLDLFYRFDPPGSWIEIIAGEEPAGHMRPASWAEDHKRLALTFGRAGDWARAEVEIEKLVREFPENPEYAINLAHVREMMGDSSVTRR